MLTITPDRLNSILEHTKNKRIAVFGDLMLDVYLWGSATRLSQEAPVPVLQIKEKNTRLGGAANVMRNLSALSECAISAFGVVGNDDQGKMLCRLLAEGGVDPQNVLADSSRRTTEKQRVIAGNQQVVRMDFEDTEQVSEALRKSLADELKRQIVASQVHAVIFEDYAKGLLEKQMLQEITDLARAHGVYTSLDPHPGHAMEVHSLSLMTPNRAEAFGLAGIYHYSADPVVERDVHLRTVASRIMESWNPDSLLVTLGHQGMALFDRLRPDIPLVIPTVAKEVFDVSGAGDTVISVYTLCMVGGATPEEAAIIANHAAGIVVGKVGTAIPLKEELYAAFR